uniref:Uncharacterized protein n=1 Tax=Parascaris equorum TaxID=6256 RepID=A0A914RSL9_PAREQ
MSAYFADLIQEPVLVRFHEEVILRLLLQPVHWVLLVELSPMNLARRLFILQQNHSTSIIDHIILMIAIISKRMAIVCARCHLKNLSSKLR